ncbi:MAG: FAD-dependent oxidoreductase, partial [Cyanobacteria bacterium J06642_11]
RYSRYRNVSTAALRTQGIDVILESASFTRNCHLTLSQCSLKASRYLLTDGYGFSPFRVEKPNKPLWCHQLIQLDSLPQKIAIIGSGTSVVEWAYKLSQFAAVSILCNTPDLLPSEDRDIQRLVKVQLQYADIFVHFVSDLDIEANKLPAIVDAEIAVSVPRPDGPSELALEKLGVSAKKGIKVNRYLQTQSPKLYVTGSCLGGEHNPAITRQETEIALTNALFSRQRPIQYEQITYGMDGGSTMGRWGMTERQANHRCGERVQVFRASCLPLKNEDAAQTNFCKLIVLENRLLGIHLLGHGALSLARQFGGSLTMTMLAKRAAKYCEPGTGTLIEAVYGAFSQWEDNRWQPGKWRRDWAENWFNWCRRSC